MRKSFCDRCLTELIAVPANEIKRTIGGQNYLIELHVYYCAPNSVEGSEAELCLGCFTGVCREALNKWDEI